MPKKLTQKESTGETLFSVKEEMAKLRMAQSAREELSQHAREVATMNKRLIWNRATRGAA
jgi:uncharacterized protein YxjI